MLFFRRRKQWPKSFLEINDNEDPHCKIDDLIENLDGLILLTGSADGFFGKLFF